MRQQDLPAPHQHRIGPRPLPVTLPRHHAFAKPPHFRTSSVGGTGCPAYIGTICQPKGCSKTPGNQMTPLSQIAWDDTVLPFQLDRADVR
ncbi:hypothetical protein EOM89_12060, partial [Candidatus Falkowbacteria bacterium]|nr:hypothetical protein [Candidatus Falkowbacteria bacterium]